MAQCSEGLCQPNKSNEFEIFSAKKADNNSSLVRYWHSPHAFRLAYTGRRTFAPHECTCTLQELHTEIRLSWGSWSHLLPLLTQAGLEGGTREDLWLYSLLGKQQGKGEKKTTFHAMSCHPRGLLSLLYPHNIVNSSWALRVFVWPSKNLSYELLGILLVAGLAFERHRNTMKYEARVCDAAWNQHSKLPQVRQISAPSSIDSAFDETSTYRSRSKQSEGQNFYCLDTRCYILCTR